MKQLIFFLHYWVLCPVTLLKWKERRSHESQLPTHYSSGTGSGHSTETSALISSHKVTVSLNISSVSNMFTGPYTKYEINAHGTCMGNNLKLDSMVVPIKCNRYTEKDR